MRRRFVWDVPPLDWAAMDETAAILVGRHDFNSFRNLGSPLGSRGSVRTLMGLWREPGASPAETVWRAWGDGFLKQMVRNLVGCLVAVGKGKAKPADVRLILERCDRNHGLPTAPARGLCMERVFYPGDADMPAMPADPDQASVVREGAAHDQHHTGDGCPRPEPEGCGQPD